MPRSWSHGHSVIGVTVTAFVGSMVARVIISPLIPAFLAEFDVSRGLIGLALTGMWATTALMQFPAGVLGQRFGEARIILVALGLTVLGSLALAAAPGFYAFTAAVVVLGVAGGLYMPVAASFLTKEFPETGRVLGIHSIGAPIGGLVGPVVAAYFLARQGWRATPLVVAMAVVGIGLVFRSTVDYEPVPRQRRTEAGRTAIRSLLALFVRPGVRSTAVLAAVGFFVYQSFTSFFPTFLVQYAGFSDGVAGLLFGGTFATAIVGAPALGWLSDRFGRDVVLVGGFLAAASGIGVFLATTNALAIVLGTVLAGIGISWNGVINSRLMDRFSDAERTVSFGFVRTGVLLVASLGSVVTGTLADVVGWAPTFSALAALMGTLALGLVAINLTGRSS